MMEHEIIHIEDRDIYDGWCAEYNLKTKEITWRDAWFTNKLTPEFKAQWEQEVKAIYDKQAQELKP
jgi:hypothetical protein